MYSDSATPTAPADQAYPCPCKRRGNLVPIYLTEAYGCDRCPHMFVLEADGKLVEQTTGGYPQPGTWRWSGKQWQAIAPAGRDQLSPLISALAPLIILGVGWWLFSHWLTGPGFWLALGIGLLVISGCGPRLNARFRRRR
jgi:hypothetical protein